MYIYINIELPQRKKTNLEFDLNDIDDQISSLRNQIEALICEQDEIKFKVDFERKIKEDSSLIAEFKRIINDQK